MDLQGFNLEISVIVAVLQVFRAPKTEKFHNESMSNQVLDKTNIAGQRLKKNSTLAKIASQH